jgi:hypothetical protein
MWIPTNLIYNDLCKKTQENEARRDIKVNLPSIRAYINAHAPDTIVSWQLEKDQPNIGEQRLFRA